MKRTFLCLLLPALLGGCFYEVPISSEPSREIDKAVLGDWIVLDEPTGKLTVTEGDAKTYSVSYLPPKEGSNEPELLKFKGHHTQVGSKDFVSLQLVGAKGEQNGKWLFVTFKVSEPDKLQVWTVSGKVVPYPEPGTEGAKLVTPEAMRGFFEDVIDRPDLLTPEPLEFTRVK